VLNITFEAKMFVADSGHYPGPRPFRVTIGSDLSIDLSPGTRLSNDLTLSHLGEPLIVIDFELASSLDGKELVIAVTTAGSELVLRER